MEEQGGPHDKLIDFVATSYPNMDRNELATHILGSQDNFNKSLNKLYRDINTDTGSFDDFKSMYLSEYGDPFKKKTDGGITLEDSSSTKSAPTADLTYKWEMPGAETIENPIPTTVPEPESTQFENLPTESKEAFIKESAEFNIKSNNQLSYNRLAEKRKGDYTLTGDEIVTTSQYDFDRNKRTSLVEKALWDKKEAIGDEGTLAEYEYQIGNIQADINDLSGAIPHLKTLITDKYGKNVFEEINEKSDLLSAANGKQLSSEEYQSLTKTQEELKAIHEDPLMGEYIDLINLYERNIEKAKGLLAEDNYKLVSDLKDHLTKMEKKEETESAMPVTGIDQGPFLAKQGLKLLAASVAKMTGGIGTILDIGEAFITGDDEYSWFDEYANDFLIDLEKDVKFTFPTPTRWSRPLFTNTVELNGLEYDIKDGKIQSIRDDKGTEIKRDLSEEETKVILSKDTKRQYNSSGLPYKGAALTMDLATQIMVTRGIGKTLGGSKRAFQIGVVGSTMGQMSSDLYKEGLIMFKGDKKKAGKYALGVSAGIGLASNLFGMEARLAGGQASLADKALSGSVKTQIGRRVNSFVVGGAGEVVEETFIENLIDNGVRSMLGAENKQMGFNEFAETALLSFAAGGAGNIIASKGEINDNDAANLLALVENKDKAPGFIEAVLNDPDKTDKAVHVIDVVAGKMGVMETNDKEAAVAAAYDHTIAEINLEKAKASKIEPLIEAREAEMEAANDQMAKVLELKVENPELEEGETVQVEELKKPKTKKPAFEAETVDDEIATFFREEGRIGQADYEQYGDRNKITNATGSVNPTLFRTVLNKDKGTTQLDVLAEEIAEKTGNSHEDVLNQLVEFIETKSPKKHITESHKKQVKAKEQQMTVEQFEEYEQKRDDVYEKYVGENVEASDAAKEVVGDFLMGYEKDGNVDMGFIEPEVLKLAPEPQKILLEAINKSKDKALSFQQQENETTQDIKIEEVQKELPAKEIKKDDTKSVEKPIIEEQAKEAKEEKSIEKELPDAIEKGDAVQMGGVPMGKVQVKKMNRFFSKLWKNMFKSEGILPKDVFNLNNKRSAAINTSMQEVAFATTDLQRVIKKSFKKGLDDGKMEELGDILKTEDLVTDFKDGTEIPTEVLEQIQKIRNHVTSLSKELMDSGFLADELKVIFDKNLNTYLHRSYRVHTDPDWIDKVTDLPQFNKAVEWVVDTNNQLLEDLNARLIESDLNISKRKANNLDTTIEEGKNSQIKKAIKKSENKLKDPRAIVLAMLEKQKAKLSMGSVSKKGTLGAKDLGIFAKKKNIPEAIRELYGEFTDPVTTYAHSIFKMAHLLENHKMLERIKESGLGKFLFEEPQGDYVTQIASEGDETLSPLDGLYTTPEFADAFQSYNKPIGMPPLLQWIVAGSASVKYSKTILSIATQSRNFFQNIWYHWANGHLLKMYNPKEWGESLNVAWASMEEWAKGSEHAREEHLKMLELGIIHESSTYGEMRALLDDFSMGEGVYNPDDQFVKRGIKKVKKKAEGLYAFGDDAHKYYAYLLERQRYAKALIKGKKYADLNANEQQEIDVYVADIIRDTYQTYSMLSPGVKAARVLPFTKTFISFPAELYRNTINNISQGWKEVRSDNKAIKKIGASRIAGTVSLYGVFAAMSKAAFSHFDMGDEDDFKWFLQPWNEDSIIIPTWRDGKDSRVVSISSTIPHGQIFEMMEIALDGRKDGGEKIEAIGGKALGTFLGWDIFTQSMIESVSGERSGRAPLFGKDDPHKMQKRALHMWNAFQPGTMTSGIRLMKSIFDPQLRHGKLDPVTEIFAMFPGVRVSPIDIEYSAGFKAYDLGQRRRTSLSLYRSRAKLDKYKKLDSKAREAALKEYKDNALQSYQSMFEEASEIFAAAIRLGADKQILIRKFKDNGFSKPELSAIVNGYPYEPLKNE